MDYLFEIKSEKDEYSGFLGLKSYWLQHSLFQGGMSPQIRRERVESYRAVSVLPYDPQNDSVVLIEQFRIGALENPRGPWVLEVIGGIIEQEETAESVARREAVEEAGCTLLDLEPVCDFMVSPGSSTEQIQIYCARVDATDVAGIHGLPEEGEDIRVEVLSWAEAEKELYQGRINSTSTIIAMQWLSMNRDRLRQQWLY
ncbi:MAG: NUDIX domain-containing protein [Gammaproteobacteria bacterium]|nr:NUDIX domain-containing protein [Gammaproteobacteria bacterium]